MAKRAGRPKESTNREYDQVDKVVSRCARCGSTERTEYTGRSVNNFQATYTNAADGKPYNRIVYQTCQCTQCHQWRKDRSYELVTSEDRPEDGI